MAGPITLPAPPQGKVGGWAAEAAQQSRGNPGMPMPNPYVAPMPAPVSPGMAGGSTLMGQMPLPSGGLGRLLPGGKIEGAPAVTAPTVPKKK